VSVIGLITLKVLGALNLIHILIIHVFIHLLIILPLISIWWIVLHVYLHIILI